MTITSTSTEFFAFDLSHDTPTIDLHGKHVDEALSELQHVISRELSLKSDAVRIIHGRGSGVLRKAIHMWLAQEKTRGHIRAFQDSDAPSRSGGVTIVLLPRKGRRS